MTIWSKEIKELTILFDSLQKQRPKLVKELEQLVKTEDANVVLLYSRRCLEVIITDLCESELERPRKTEPLKGVIDKLNKEEKVPSNIITSMQHLNSLATYGAHPKEYDLEQVKPVLNNLTTIIKWYNAHRASGSKPGAEGAVFESQRKLDADIDNHKQKKKLIITLSGLLLVTIIVVLIVFGVIGSREQTKNNSDLEKSIAVLPFDNMSVDEEYFYMGDAITDEIILELQKIKIFDRVLSRSSTMQYKENRPAIPEIADKLGVNYIIEGSIQRHKDDVSIRVQVIRARNEDHVWAVEYDFKWEDIFSVQDEIAFNVANELNTVLSAQEIEQINKKPTDNLESYNFYLKGRFFWHRRTEEDLLKSIDYYNKAIELDSTYALAYVGLADAYFILPWYSSYLTDDGFIKAKIFAERALSINTNIAEAHSTLGALAFWHERDWDLAEEELKLAIKLNPNYYTAHQSYYELLNILGRNEEAEEQIDLAIKLNPNFFILLNQRAEFYYSHGRYENAIEEFNKVLEINYWFNSMAGILNCYLRVGKDNEAIDRVKAIISRKDSINYDKFFDELYQESGIEGIIYWYIDWLIINEPIRSYNIAILYGIMGNESKTLEYVEKVMERDQPGKLDIYSETDFKILEDNPRFIAFKKELGL